MAEAEIRDYGTGSNFLVRYVLTDDGDQISLRTKHWLVDCNGSWCVAVSDRDFQSLSVWPFRHSGGASGSKGQTLSKDHTEALKHEGEVCIQTATLLRCRGPTRPSGSAS